jgi:hypothetical protein
MYHFLSLRFLRWEYHAKVINIFERISSPADSNNIFMKGFFQALIDNNFGNIIKYVSQNKSACLTANKTYYFTDNLKNGKLDAGSVYILNAFKKNSINFKSSFRSE